MKMSENKIKQIGSKLKNGGAKVEKIFVILEKKAIQQYYSISVENDGIYEVPCKVRPTWVKYI